ncbi:MAG TPA: phage tail tube protein [Bacteroidales bacterium]|nr:phage tail tube protein [Bacteroidales bacterium]
MDTIINGSDLFVFMNDVPVAHSTSHTLSIKMGTRNTSNKGTGKFETKAPGRLDVTVSAEGLCVDGDYNALMNAMVLRVPVTLELGKKSDGAETLDTSEFYAHGDFLITAFDQNAGDQANATYSVSFEHYEGFSFTPDANLIVRTNQNATAAAVFVTGGVEPYTYAWNGGGTNFYKSSLTAGTHTCTVTDSSTPIPLTGQASVVIS